jgi:hypothetical protein
MLFRVGPSFRSKPKRCPGNSSKEGKPRNALYVVDQLTSAERFEDSHTTD